MFDRDIVVLGIAGFVTVGATISTLEWLANWRQLQDNGLFSWRVVRTRPALARGGLLTVGRAVLAYPNVLVLLVVRLAALLTLIPALVTGTFVPLSLGLVVATTLLLNLRGGYGMDGSDQMATHVFGALFLGLLPGTSLALEAAVWYIALQACLSYATAGLAKVFSPQWQRGDTVFAIFNTRTYGHAGVARFLHGRPRLTRLLSWGAVAAEVTFPLAIVVGYPYCLVFVAWGVAFHAMNALVMGLNSFFWSFVATYPAVIYCAQELSG